MKKPKHLKVGTRVNFWSMDTKEGYPDKQGIITSLSQGGDGQFYAWVGCRGSEASVLVPVDRMETAMSAGEVGRLLGYFADTAFDPGTLYHEQEKIEKALVELLILKGQQ